MMNRYISKERIEVYGVSYNCPAGIRRKNCPLKDFDNLSFEEKVERINAFNKEDIEKIIEHHKSCSKLGSRR